MSVAYNRKEDGGTRRRPCKGVGELRRECVKDHCEEREYMWNVSPQRRVRKL